MAHQCAVWGSPHLPGCFRGEGGVGLTFKSGVYTWQGTRPVGGHFLSVFLSVSFCALSPYPSPSPERVVLRSFSGTAVGEMGEGMVGRARGGIMELFTLPESPLAHLKAGILAKMTDYRDLSVIVVATMPRGFPWITEVWEHTEKRWLGDAAVSQGGTTDEESDEEVGEGGGGRRRTGRRTRRRGRAEGPEATWRLVGVSWDFFGSLFDNSWGVVGASWRPQGLLGASWVSRGSLFGLLGGFLGPSSGILPALLRPPGHLLGLLGGHR